MFGSESDLARPEYASAINAKQEIVTEQDLHRLAFRIQFEQLPRARHRLGISPAHGRLKANSVDPVAEIERVCLEQSDPQGRISISSRPVLSLIEIKLCRWWACRRWLRGVIGDERDHDEERTERLTAEAAAPPCGQRSQVARTRSG